MGRIKNHFHDEICVEAAELIAKLTEALRPFASHVGKSGEVVKLSIGQDTWTNTLSTEDFERARAILTKVRSSRDEGLGG